MLTKTLFMMEDRILGQVGLYAMWTTLYLSNLIILFCDNTIGPSRDFNIIANGLSVLYCGMSGANMIFGNKLPSSMMLTIGPIHQYLFWLLFAYYGGSDVLGSHPIGVYNWITLFIVGLFTVDMVGKTWFLSLNPDKYKQYMKEQSINNAENTLEEVLVNDPIQKVVAKFNFKEGKKFQTIRHVIRPSVNYSINPSFEKYYDEYHEIDLGSLEPHIVGPHTPDLGRPVSAMSAEVDEKDYPEKLSAALIGSCTNSSYEDMTRAVSLVRQAKAAGLKAQSNLMVTPGSETIYQTIKRDGILQEFEDVGGTVLANACGPCIGQWKREDMKKGDKNSILTSYNRNFAKRNDGNPETLGFISSPELVVAMAFGGSMKFNPLTDTLKDKNGNDFKFQPPEGEVLPPSGYTPQDAGYEAPTMSGEVVISPTSERLSFLDPFPKQDPIKDYQDLPVLFKASGKCTTDHISQAGPWLKFRGHLDNISNNMFLGATNAFHSETGYGNNPVTGEENQELNKIARNLKDSGLGWVAFAGENVGEGSSREHAAMEPRHMGCMAFVANSYARIFEANLKKQAVLPFTFSDKSDYDKVHAKDRISCEGLDQLAPGKPVTLSIKHEDGSSDSIQVNHTLNDKEINWFKYGSCLNFVGSQK